MNEQIEEIEAPMIDVNFRRMLDDVKERYDKVYGNEKLGVAGIQAAAKVASETLQRAMTEALFALKVIDQITDIVGAEPEIDPELLARQEGLPEFLREEMPSEVIISDWLTVISEDLNWSGWSRGQPDGEMMADDDGEGSDDQPEDMECNCPNCTAERERMRKRPN